MVQLSFDELNHYRPSLEGGEDYLLQALTAIEDCDGDLEDAAIVLALRAGQEPDQTDRWLEGQAKLWRAYLCQDTIQSALVAGQLAEVGRSLATETAIEPLLALPVLLYVLKTGVEPFCKPLR